MNNSANRVLVDAISEHTEALFQNVNAMLKTCDLDYILYELPVWKHVYHTLHSLDRWFINPNRYTEPSFHVDGLNSLDESSEKTLSRGELLDYFETIKLKLRDYISGLTDEQLSEPPESCERSRLSMILGAYRHLYAHLGNINATTILETGKWPRVKGFDFSPDTLYE
jgi:hypothetical protein